MTSSICLVPGLVFLPCMVIWHRRYEYVYLSIIHGYSPEAADLGLGRFLWIRFPGVRHCMGRR